MTVRERRLILLEAGFQFYKQGAKHELWTNGRETVALSKGSYTSPCTLNSFKSKMRRYKKLLEGKSGVKGLS